nr:hypothetical protein BaRGS_023402 [Batillaria attramentaria]
MVMSKNVWASKVVSIRTKLRNFNFNVKSVLLYGCETWRTTKTVQQKIQTFLNTCLRRIFNIRWPEKIRNEELWERAGQGTSGQADPAEEVGLDWTHPQEASIQHHTRSPDMEPAGEKEERPAAGGGTLRQSYI